MKTAAAGRKRKRTFYVLGTAGILLLAYIFIFDPETSQAYPSCVFHFLTGLHCAGCGITRALYCLIHGDLQGALAKNSLAVFGIPAGFVFYRLFPRWIYYRWTPAICMAVLVMYTVMRNIPAAPFSYLAPH